MKMRQIILDTETTGLEPKQGHKIIEIGCIEMVNRRMTGNTFHYYIQPNREIDEAAIEVHGITLDMLQDKPVFADLAGELLDFLKGGELIIHNAPFDVGFLNYEFEHAGSGHKVIDQHCTIVDTLVMARHKHPGQKNNLNALCKRYGVDNSQRQLHGALLDAEILADVYLLMTGGQISLLGESDDLMQIGGSQSGGITSGQSGPDRGATLVTRRAQPVLNTPVIRASEEERAAHQLWLELLEKETSGQVVWNKLNENVEMASSPTHKV